jgi:hypothetical protein
MKFIYADSLDVMDPGYDFVADRNAAGRTPQWDDVYAHEILGYAPYHGILVSRGIVGGDKVSGKYSEAQAMRFRRVGARAFLRLQGSGLDDLPIFGDCGAFTYHKEDLPPYTSEDMAEFYSDGEFTHGCSVDHIIFDFDEGVAAMEGGTDDTRRRFDITIENAESFLKASRHISNSFTALGVIQGWSPGSMAEAARRLVAMGYDYLALGGTVPLKAPQIRACVAAIREAIPKETRLHILGFAKASEIESFAPLGITSFDTTSPLIRAFKDAKANYYLPYGGGRLTYYTAIRVPQALENTKLLRLVKRGVLSQDELVEMEKAALGSLRAYDRSECSLDETLEAVLAYAAPAVLGATLDDLPGSSTIGSLRERYMRTLADRPWHRCPCAICREIGIEVIIFRASNRNKRRGIHNLGVYEALVRNLDRRDNYDGQADLFGDTSPTESSPHGPLLPRACL